MWFAGAENRVNQVFSTDLFSDPLGEGGDVPVAKATKSHRQVVESADIIFYPDHSRFSLGIKRPHLLDVRSPNPTERTCTGSTFGAVVTDDRLQAWEQRPGISSAVDMAERNPRIQ